MKVHPLLWWAQLDADQRDAFNGLRLFLAQADDATLSKLLTLAQSQPTERSKTVARITEHKAMCVQAGLSQAKADKLETLFPNIDWAALWAAIQKDLPVAITILTDIINALGI